MKPTLPIQLSGLFATLVLASAVPVPVSGPVAGPGDGLNLRAVQFTPSVVHNIAGAEAALGLAPGDPFYIGEVNGSANHIDMADGNYGGEITATHDAVPFAGGDPLFAVRFSGFLNVTIADDYVFRSYTDDGFRLTLGGEVISQFDGDRAPGESISPIIPLTPGLYAIEFIGWEQGGLFVDELSWARRGSRSTEVPDSEVFFRSVPVPDGGSTAILFGVAAIALGAFSRKERSDA